MKIEEVAKRYKLDGAFLKKILSEQNEINVYNSDQVYNDDLVQIIALYKQRANELDAFKAQQAKTLQEKQQMSEEKERASAEHKTLQAEKRQKLDPYVNAIRKNARAYLDNQLIYNIEGCRGRSIKVYPDKCIINVFASMGAILTGNGFDGEKTIYYKDVIGVQYKEPGVVIGYLQLETASGLTNNEKSNLFNENTFTFEKNLQEVREAYEFIIGTLDVIKRIDCENE